MKVVIYHMKLFEVITCFKLNLLEKIFWQTSHSIGCRDFQLALLDVVLRADFLAVVFVVVLPVLADIPEDVEGRQVK